jgi:hypothetical protein
MNLVSYEFGQALQFIRMDEVRPFSGLYLPDVIRIVAERYRFITVPTDIATANTTGVKFGTGVISLAGRQIAVTSLGIYNDGLLVETKNTDDADLVIDDLILWAVATFGFREPQKHTPRKHGSNLVVDFDASIDRFLSNFGLVAGLFESAVKAAQGIEIETHLTRLAIGADPQDGLPAKPTTFFIEVRLNTPFAEKRYFSGAPLTSDAHLELLAKIEKVLA